MDLDNTFEADVFPFQRDISVRGPEGLEEENVSPLSRCINMVIRSDSKKTVGEKDQLALLDPFYDLTANRMQKLFHAFDVDGKT